MIIKSEDLATFTLTRNEVVAIVWQPKGLGWDSSVFGKELLYLRCEHKMGRRGWWCHLKGKDLEEHTTFEIDTLHRSAITKRMNAYLTNRLVLRHIFDKIWSQHGRPIR